MNLRTASASELGPTASGGQGSEYSCGSTAIPRGSRSRGRFWRFGSQRSKQSMRDGQSSDQASGQSSDRPEVVDKVPAGPLVDSRIFLGSNGRLVALVVDLVVLQVKDCSHRGLSSAGAFVSQTSRSGS